MINLRNLAVSLALSASAFAAEPTPFLLKWDSSIATPNQQGLVTLKPGTVVTLEAGKTNDVFRIFGVPVPEAEAAHRAVRLEFRYRFLQGTNEVANDTIRTDKHGVFTPAHHPEEPWEKYKPASQELFSTETFTVPDGADALELERVAVDTLNGKKKVGERLLFALVGNEKAFLVLSGQSRGDEKGSPNPFLLGQPITAGKPLTIVYDEYRAMNAWVRTGQSKMFGQGFIASYSGADIRTMTCVNKEPNKVYYSAWADMPLFEISMRVRFDQGEWQELPKKKLYPAWSPGNMQTLFPIPFETIPGVVRAMGPFVQKNTATIFPIADTSKLAPLHTQSITVPPHAKTVALKTWIHGYMIPHYGKYFGGTGYVGADCVRLFEDGQRIELQDVMDSPDFTPESAWTYPVN